MKLDTSIYGNTFLQKQLLVVCKNLSSKHLFTYFTYWKNDTVKVTFSRFIFLIDICLERRRGRWRFLFNTSLSCKFTSSVDLLYLNSSFFVLRLFYPTNMLEVNNGNTRGKCEIWCSKPTKKDTRTVLVFLLQACTYFTHFSSVFIIDFEQVHVCCVMTFVTPSNRQIQTT